MLHAAHRALALILGLFILSHFAAHLLALGGPEAHEAALKILQQVYRNRFVEPLLALAFLVQIIIGARFVMRRWREPQKTFWAWAQILSGGYIAFFVLMHFSSALMARHAFGIDTNFYWPGGTLVTAPLKYVFAPYYFLAALAFYTHIGAALHFNLQGAAAIWAPRILAGAGVAYGVTVVLIFSGALFPFTLPPEYADYFAGYLPD